MSNYPRDEFDKIPETSSRQGVHRSRMESPKRRGLGLGITVGILVLAVALAAFLVLPRLGISSGESPLAAGTSSADAGQGGRRSPEPGNSPAGSPTDRAAAPTGARDSGATASPTSGSPQSTQTATPGSSIDKTTPVAVFNGTGVSGLAGSVAGDAQASGWAVPLVSNWTGQPQATSVIYYASPEQEANAKALGQLLNIVALVDSTAFQQPLTVVLAPGYQR